MSYFAAVTAHIKFAIIFNIHTRTLYYLSRLYHFIRTGGFTQWKRK